MPRTHRPRRAGARQSHKASMPRYRTWAIAAVALAVLAGAYLLLRPRGGLPSEVPASQAYDMYRNGATFLDVRTPAEWDEAHIPRSVSLPLDQLEGRLGELPRDADIVVVCRSGVRSKEGMTILLQAGFTRVTCLTGGLQAWASAGYPLEARPDPG